MEKLLQIGKEFGLQGEKLLEFVCERQKLEEEKEEKRQLLEEDRRREDEEREAREQERDLRKLEMEADLMRQKEAAEAAKREHELELTRLGNFEDHTCVGEDRAKAPKLPSFVGGKDDLDACLQRYERFVTTTRWDKTGWASKLSAPLSGHALKVYFCLSEEAATDYDQMKLALIKRYDLREDGYHHKFRASKLETDESPDQFFACLKTYLFCWLDLSKMELTFEGLTDRIAKEQFIDSCPKDLAIHLCERAPETLAQIAIIADQYLEAHGKHLFSTASRKPTVQPERDEAKNTQFNATALQCFKCNT